MDVRSSDLRPGGEGGASGRRVGRRCPGRRRVAPGGGARLGPTAGGGDRRLHPAGVVRPRRRVDGSHVVRRGPAPRVVRGARRTEPGHRQVRPGGSRGGRVLLDRRGGDDPRERHQRTRRSPRRPDDPRARGVDLPLRGGRHRVDGGGAARGGRLVEDAAGDGHGLPLRRRPLRRRRRRPRDPVVRRHRPGGAGGDRRAARRGGHVGSGLLGAHSDVRRPQRGSHRGASGRSRVTRRPSPRGRSGGPGRDRRARSGRSRP